MPLQTSKREDAVRGGALILSVVSGAVAFWASAAVSSVIGLRIGLVQLHFFDHSTPSVKENVATYGIIGVSVLVGILVMYLTFRVVMRFARPRPEGR